ncbi:N-acetylmuramoyl-L-alanine amidase [Muribaculum sp. An289]|uniref:LamG-like jellyroll fold domain-containing protein n=1 Tax=Muribaculum sp. An289 TaxID=1965624 RepID=UPI000B39074B|nr:LamG-like jellyroll fold domain-containing protein [Muribaculum sp. An289]OUO38337.1 N-acetylmuramoyl-L-alanine amidase [Muribaculum sp. An289]
MGEIEVIKRKGGTIQLFSRDPFCTVKSATQNISLMGDDNIQLSIISTELLDFEKGDKIIVCGEEYTIRTRATREMKTDRYYQYDAVFYGVMYELMKTQYRNTDESGKSTSMTFDLTYSIRDFVKVIIYNMNRDYPGLWAFDEANCPDTEPRTISFSKQNCLQVLQSLCSDNNFKLEFRITQNNGVRTIHIGKFGTKVVPPNGSDYFEWGKGGGLFTLKDQKVDDKAIITRLWVEGGTTNIRSDYRNYSERLQLPYPKRMNKNEHTLADGTVIPANSEMIGIDDDNKRYIEDAELAQEIGSEEDGAQYDDIYPKRTGVVTAIVEDDINSFVDDTMDFDLNEKDDNGTKYLINGVTAKITFITGRLAGQQFEVKADGGYDHAKKQFTLIPFTDKRGLTIPTTDSEAFRVEVGNTYKITDINLPKSYEDNAEEDLWYAGYDDFKPRTQSRVQYALTFDRSYFLENLPDDSETSVFKVGDYVPVKDVRFGVEKSIRIQKISRNLLVDHDYSLTLSDTTTISISQQTVIDVIEHNKIIEANRLKDLSKARRGWRTTEELRNMVYDTDGYFDPENIRPNSIDTNMLTVGSKSQQFVLIGVVMQANVNGNANRFDASSGILAHLTIDETTIKQWNLSELSVTLSEQGGYYVFAKCSKTGSNGVFVVTQTPYKFEPTEDPNNYYFQIGIISSLYPDDNFRDFVTTYGFTRINGKTITTGAIVTSDGECYLDLDGNKFRIGDTTSSIDWNVTALKQLTLHNVRLLSDSGDVSFIGVYRGDYNEEYVYYTGDEVSYSNGAETCTYRYIYPTPAKGITPTNTTYWKVVAKGQQGQKGDDGLPGEDGLPGKSYYTWIRYADDVNGTGISDNPTGKGFIGFAYNKETPTESNDPKDYKWSDIMGKDGVPGEPGEDGKTLYTWIAYSDNADGNPMYQQPKDTTMYIGIATNKETATESDDPKDYVWSKFKGDDGLPGVPGADGKTSYFHIKYSSVQNPTSASQMTETPSDYIGTYVDYTQADSNDPKKYTWARFKGFNGEDGLPGINGEDGKTSYLHIKYSDNGGLSFTANNGEEPGAYIGQYVDFIQKDSDNPTDYTWSLIKGESGAAGSDATTGEYYEYRYAKNGSTVSPPALDADAENPAGWSTTMPTVGNLEYLWCTMAKKSGLSDKKVFDIPVQQGETTLLDITGHGVSGALKNGASVVQDGSRYAVDLSDNAECQINWDLPFGQSFTLCFWMKTDQTLIRWMLNGYNGRDYVEKSITVSKNTWFHVALRFNDRTVSIFINGSLVQTGSINEEVVGFSMYDDNMFGSSVFYDNIRLYDGALSATDIGKDKSGASDKLVQNWCTPFRINPYDGKDGVGINTVDVEYAKSSSNTTAPTSGWQTTAPAWEDGKYIWSRTKTVLTDGSTEYTKAVCITGGKGATGSTGVGVKSIVEQYYLSSSPTSQTGGSWSTTRPTWKDGWYIWTRSVITYTNGTSTTTAAICVTGGKGETGDPGEKGDQGESPAAVYQGTYNSSKTYYGTKYRLDVVKYNGIFYIARIDAGTFSGVVPTNTSKWNPFGAQFESVATNLLLAENANIAGWVFRNNRLEAQNGSIYLDGVNGEVRLQGTMQLSTGWSGVFSDVNIFYLPATTSLKTISMGQDMDDIGKVCRLYNSGEYGQGNYQIGVYSFTAEAGFSSSVLDYYALVRPQEIVEMTCFELPGSTSTVRKGRWEITSRFAWTDFVTSGAKGRHPLILAIGRISGTNSGASISGTWWDGKSITSILSVSRQAEGKYRVSFSSSNIPSGYRVMLTGYGTVYNNSDSPVKGTIMALSTTYFDVWTSDDSTRNDGSCEFIILAPEWQYKF